MLFFYFLHPSCECETQCQRRELYPFALQCAQSIVSGTFGPWGQYLGADKEVVSDAIFYTGSDAASLRASEKRRSSGANGDPLWGPSTHPLTTVVQRNTRPRFSMFPRYPLDFKAFRRCVVCGATTAATATQGGHKEKCGAG